MEAYSLDPKRFSLDLFYEQTRAKQLIPSRLKLLNGLEQNLLALRNLGIDNLQQLIRALGNREKIFTVAAETNISPDYLTLLKREAGSYFKKPFPLSEFPGIPMEYTEVLLTRGIRNTKEFFESLQNEGLKAELHKQTGIPESRLMEIYCLCDLSRISGVGASFARIIYRSGIRSVLEFAQTDPTTQLKKYREIFDKEAFPFNPPGKEDVQYCINYAMLLVELNTEISNG